MISFFLDGSRKCKALWYNYRVQQPNKGIPFVTQHLTVKKKYYVRRKEINTNLTGGKQHNCLISWQKENLITYEFCFHWLQMKRSLNTWFPAGLVYATSPAEMSVTRITNRVAQQSIDQTDTDVLFPKSQYFVLFYCCVVC